MGIESRIDLIVAAMDLKVVQLLRQAMRSADAAGRASTLGPAANVQPRQQIHPEPHINPRQRITPTPRYEPRPVIHPTPREAPPAPPPAEPEKSHVTPSPIQPPWKVLPWQISPAPAVKIKVVLRRPDVVSRGTLMDVFV